MSYVPGNAHDIFVSYAHVDDLTDREDEDGWVTALVKKLKNRLAQLLGRQDNFSLWYDHQLRRNVLVTPEIMGAIERTATLVVILSPGYLESEWCTREKDTFLKLVDERRANEGRVFLIERDKIELEARPPEFGDLLGYHFWKEDRQGRLRTLRISRSGDDESAFLDVLEDLRENFQTRSRNSETPPWSQRRSRPSLCPQNSAIRSHRIRPIRRALPRSTWPRSLMISTASAPR